MTPWTAIAPTGSSIFSRFSMKSAASTTRTPEIAPMRTETGAFTNAQGAVIATIPASMPLTAIDVSGRLNFFQV